MSERSVQKVGAIYRAGPFKIFGSDGVTVQPGRAASLTTTLYLDDVLSAVVVTATEITKAGVGQGTYYCFYTPTQVGEWSLFVVDPVNNAAGWQDDINAQIYNDDDIGPLMNSSPNGNLRVDVEEWVGSIPNPLIFGRLDVTTQDIAINLIPVSSAPTTAQIAASILVTPGNLLATDSSGRVTVGTNSDKTGYSLSVTPPTTAQVAAAILATPANLLTTDGTGRVTVGTNADKTGYALTSGEHTNISGDVWNAARSSFKTAGSFGELGYYLIRTGTCQAGSTSNTLVLDASAGAFTGPYAGSLVVLTGGTGAGQVRPAGNYTPGTQTLAITSAWVITPDGTTTFALVGSAGNVDQVQTKTGFSLANGSITAATFASNALGAVWDELEASHATASTFGKVLGSIVLSAAGNVKADVEEVRSAVINALISGRIDANAQVVGDKTGYALTAGEEANIATAVWALSSAVDGTLTPAQALMYIYASTAGVTGGEPGPGTDTAQGPSGVVRLTFTFDANSNRIGVVRS